MSLEELFLNRYNSYDKLTEGYYLRIRENITDKSVSRNIKVYYKGIKAFDLDVLEKNGEKKEALSINSSVFVPNSVNVFHDDMLIQGFENIPSDLLGDVSIIDNYFKFEIGTRYGKSDEKKIDFRFADAAKKLTDNELVELVNKVYNFFNSNLKKDVKLVDIINKKTTEKNDHKIVFFLDKGNVSFDELYSLKIKLLDGVLYKLGYNDKNGFNRYFKNIDLNLKCTLKDGIILTEESLSFIEVALENRIKIYIGLEKNILDYKNTKSLDNQEKQMQQDFMVYLNNKDKEDIKLNNGEILYSKAILPFEMEYVVYAGKSLDEDDEEIEDNEKRSSSNIKGRIDNTFVEDDIAVLVEIKYGTKVIGGSNGIHKHLIDLYSCLSLNKDNILDEYERRVNVRNKVLGNKEYSSINNVKYDIVCIYNSLETDNDNLSRDAVLKKLDDIYMKNCYEAGIKGGEIKLCNCDNGNDFCKNVNCYCKNLLQMNVGQLVNLLKDSECSCDVRIILVDEKFTMFEEYSYNKLK